MRDSIKQLAVGTRLGDALMAVRDFMTVRLGRRETIGTLVNDQLATTLAVRVCRGTFVDVGAHIGSVTAKVRGKVIAIEATPEKAAALAKKFPTVTVHACAAGPSEGDVPFFVNRRKSGYSSLLPIAGGETIKVPMRRLDSLVTEADVLKIDVEGAELGVLLGAEGLIARCRPVTMFESGPIDMLAKAAIWQWFADHRYIVLTPDRVPHNGPGLTVEGFVDSHWYPRRTTNYFGIPEERREEIRERARQRRRQVHGVRLFGTTRHAAPNSKARYRREDRWDDPTHPVQG